MSGEPDDDLSTVLQHRFVSTAASDAVFVVSVIEGSDTGKAMTIHGSMSGPILVGKSPVCELRLLDPEVSRRHISLEVRGQEVHLVDLASMNRTTVNDLSVESAHLRGGEAIRMGSTVLRVERVVSPEKPPEVSMATRFGAVIGASREMRRLYTLCEKLAASNVPVVIEGETGTGKEALAEAIHEQGPLAAQPFVIFDCTAVPVNLMESELFGNERGAFTGAVAMRKGLFEQAQGGTLLIDEIGELDIALQPKLLRAVERGQIRRVGGQQYIQVQARILAATRRNLDQEVQAGRFRDDLFHRLAIGRIELPPLRDRKGDVAILARAFWREMGGDPRGLTSELLNRWESYDWPGNVRELRNVVARRLALGEDIQVSPTKGAGPQAPVPQDAFERVLALNLPIARARDLVVDAFEREYLERVLAQHGGNVTRAATASGIARRHFYRLLARSNRT